MTPNEDTGANAGGPRQLPMWTRWAARVAQFCRETVHAATNSRSAVLFRFVLRAGLLVDEFVT